MLFTLKSGSVHAVQIKHTDSLIFRGVAAVIKTGLYFLLLTVLNSEICSLSDAGMGGVLVKGKQLRSWIE